MLLSLVIPTKNRQRTAEVCVAAASAVPGDDVEIVVQDCGDEPSLGKALAQLGDRRIRYEHSRVPRSMTDNYNRATSRVRGEYVSYIGDDDAFSPHIRALAQWAASQSLPAVSFTPSGYYWPDTHHVWSGQLMVGAASGTVIRLDARREVARMSRRVSPLSHMPQVYHGLVRREVLAAMHRESGLYFDSVCPDYYAAVAVALHIDEFAHVDYPFTICGVSAKSNSMKNVTGKLASHMQEYGDVELPDLLPQVIDRATNSHVLAAHGALAAMVRFGTPELRETLNIAKYYAVTLLDAPPQASRLLRRYLRAAQTLRRSRRTALGQLLLEVGRQSVARARAKLVYRVPRGALRLRGFRTFTAEDVGAAVRLQTEVIAPPAILRPRAAEVTPMSAGF